jgi:hypothetical protein
MNAKSERQLTGAGDPPANFGNLGIFGSFGIS